MYLTGVSGGLKNEILEVLGMVGGHFPFRYLRMPLHTKSLSHMECNVLIYRIIE